MKISFHDIAQGRTPEVTIEQNSFEDLGFTVKETPYVSLTGQVLDTLTARVTGELRAFFETSCSRCNEYVEYTVETDFSYLIRVGVDSALAEKEKEIFDDDVTTLFVDEPQIDVTELVREQFLLSLPEKVVCSDDCKGLCHRCGVSLNDSYCDCHTVLQESPFAVLKKLKKQ